MSKIKDKTKILKKYFATKQGSVLAYSLVIISVMIAIAASVSIVTIAEKKSASSTNSSVQAYQIADSGVQLAIKKIKDGADEEDKKIRDIFTDCSNGVVNEDISVIDGEYKLSFFDNGTPSMQLVCDDPVEDIDTIKSVGTFKGTARAVQVAVAAGSAQKACLCKGANGAGAFWETFVPGYDEWTPEICDDVCSEINSSLTTSLACLSTTGVSVGAMSGGIPTGIPSPNCGW